MNLPQAVFTLTVMLALLIFGVGLIGIADNVRPVPRCPEDEVLVGVGDYSGGRYETYRCGPALDDFVGWPE